MLKRIRSMFRAFSTRREFNSNMSEEMRDHIQRYADDLVRRGIPREEAARLACVEFGSVSAAKEDCREARELHLFDELQREITYAARLLRKSPGFTATALLTLAICLGANLTIFAVVDSVLLRPLPFPEASRLVTMYNTYPKAGVDRDGSSIANYYERRGHIPAFSSLSIYRYANSIVGDSGATQRTPIMRVSPEFFATVGVGPAVGRAFTEEETLPHADTIAILSDTYWHQNFNADPRAIGKQIRMDGETKTVVGILPPNFKFLSSDAQIYLPLASRPESRVSSERHSGGNSIQIVARLAPGATLEQAQSQIDAQNSSLEIYDRDAQMIAAAGFRTPVVPLHADHVAAIRPTLLLLQAGALALLLIGAVNLVNLLLVRASSRTKELAVRQALGASRRHVVSEVVVETTLLTFFGGLLGLAVGAGGIKLLGAFGANHLPLGGRIAFDARLALVSLVAAIVMGVVLALPITWFNLQRQIGNALRSETRGGTTGRAAQFLRHSFIVSQIALAFILLSGAGLLALSLERAMAISPGFQPGHILTGQISLPWQNYPSGSAHLAFIEKLLDQVGHLPGVISSGVVDNIPFSGRSGKSAATVKGFVPRPGESTRGHYSYGVGGEYFSAMGFTLRGGRFLAGEDTIRPTRVCVVDEDFARYYFPNGNAIGGHLWEGSGEKSDAEAFTIVGVVGSAKQAGLTEDQAQGAIYYPYVFHGEDSLYVAVRSNLAPESLSLTLQKIVRQIDPNIPVNDVRSMETRISDSLVTRRSPALLAALFSAIALLLTAIGTYGVLSYSVSQRRREIGVRMALGAQPSQIRAQFLSLALRLLTIGSILGIFGAWLTGSAMQTVLFHVPALNLEILAGAAAVMAIVSLAACLVPSQRAARISPLEVLSGD
jgi:predicted permease